MNKNIDKNSSVHEFYLTANEFCKLVEYTTDSNKHEFISKAQKILSFVYLKASLLNRPEEIEDGEVEKFVQEEDWLYIKNNVANILGSSDRFIEIILPEQLDPENHEDVNLSECIADIYQDLKDFATTYEIGNPAGINASLYESSISFEKFWGPRLLSILAYFHNLLYSSELYEEEEFDNNHIKRQNIDTSDWLINQRFKE